MQARSTTLAIVFASAILLCHAPFRSSPRDVMERYCSLDANGEQLAPGGWLRLAKMFVPKHDNLVPNPVVLAFDKLDVIREYSIDNPTMEGRDRATMTIHYLCLGELDYNSLRFSQRSGQPSIDEHYNLFLTNHFYGIDSRGNQREMNGSKIWRIDGLPRKPYITIDTAIRYIARRSSKTTNKALKQNANQTIEVLQLLQ